MIVGLGVDLVDVGRFAAALSRTPKLIPRLFGEPELSGRKRSPNFLASRFAAKEATLKALGGQISGFCWHDIQVLGGVGQNPSLNLSGSTLIRTKETGASSWSISISHDGEMAVAVVVMESGT